MVQKFIVRGQRVTADKMARAKELRRNMTEAENILWQTLRRNQVDGLHFRRQQIIDGYIVDFYCHALSLIVEVDGEIHEKQIEEDRQRDEALTMRGFRVIRFKNKDVLERLTFVLDEIRKTCRALEKSPELT